MNNIIFSPSLLSADFSKIAEEVGITRQYMNSIYNQATLCKKTTAYAITKSIDNNAEIKDFFEEAR